MLLFNLIPLFFKYSLLLKIPPLLMLSVCYVESHYRNITNNIAHGICQVKLDTARYMLPHLDMLSLRQNETNIYVASMYLRYQYERYGNDWEKAVLAYNAGGVYYNDYNNEYTNKQYLIKVKTQYNKMKGRLSDKKISP